METESQLSSQKSWLQSHFDTTSGPSPNKRVCLFDGCYKTYAATVSHTTLRKHWEYDHGTTEDTKTVFTFHDEYHNDCIVNLIIRDHLPYSLVDKPWLKRLVRSLNPKKTILCSASLSQLINQKRVQLQHLIIKKLQDVESIALTFDIWSARKGSSGYGCVTAHHIINFRLRSLVLQFKKMPYPHDSATLAKFILDVVENFDLRSKLISITTDNASNNISAIASIKSRLSSDATSNQTLFHFRCIAHIINLAVNNALKKLKELVDPIKSFVSTIKSSTKRSERFMTIQQDLIDSQERESSELIRQPLSLISDVETRWNSTYLMLERAFLLKEAIEDSIEQIHEVPDDVIIDWDKLSILLKFLKPFHEVTQELSGEKYTTISLVCSVIPTLIVHSSQSFPCEAINDAANALKEKLCDYSKQITEPFAIAATILDPRIKLSFLSPEMHQEARSILYELTRDEAVTAESIRKSHSASIFDAIFLDETDDEIETYLQTIRETRSVDVLDFWSINETKHSKLARLAQKILCIQATSVASERVFSLAGLVDTPRRNRLSSSSFTSNVLLNSWLNYLEIN